MKKKICTLSVLLLVNFFVYNITVFGQSSTWQWAKSIHGIGQDQGYSIVLDMAGNVYTTGYYGGQADFDPGNSTYYLNGNGIFISKLTNNGTFLWAKALSGSNGNAFSYSITVDSTGYIYIAGTFYGTIDFDPGPASYNITSAGNTDIFICKLDTAGNFVWAKSMGGIGAGGAANAVALDSAGNVIIAGEFSGTADFDPGILTYNLISNTGTDLFILKLDNGGNYIWAVAAGGTSNAAAHNICTDATGNIYATGYFKDSTDFDPANTVYFLNTAGGSEVFILKLNATGNFVWAKGLGGTGDDYGNAIALDAYGNIYTSGWFRLTCDFDPGTGIYNLSSAGSLDVFIIKLASNGNFIWAASIGSNGFDSAHGMAVDAAGNVLTTGSFENTVDFDPGTGIFNLTAVTVAKSDIFISKLSPSGSFIDAVQAGGAEPEAGISIALDAAGNAYVTGYFASDSLFFNSNSITNQVTSTISTEIFMAKLINGVSEVENILMGNNISIYPNPSVNHSININCTSVIDKIEIYNVLGKVVYTVKPCLKDNVIKMEQEGIYFAAITMGKMQCIKKLIVK